MIFVEPIVLRDLCSPAVCFIGDPATQIAAIGVLGDVPDDAICFAQSNSILKRILATACRAVLAKREDYEELPEDLRDQVVFCIADNPAREFAAILEQLAATVGDLDPRDEVSIPPDTVVSTSANVAKSVRMGESCIICAGVFVGPGVVLGNQVEILPNAVVLERCIIGNRVRIGPLTVIGSDANWYYRDTQVYCRFRSIGRVVIEDDVTVGANVCIDRGLVGDTIVGAHSVIGNLAQLGHEAHIGRNSLISAQVGISGCVSLGHDNIIYAQSGVDSHVRTGRGFVLNAKSGLTKSVAGVGGRYFGIPAAPMSVFQQKEQALRRLVSGKRRITADMCGQSLGERITLIIAYELSVEEAAILPFETLAAVGADSLDVAGLGSALDDEFEIPAVNDVLREDTRIVDVVRMVARARLKRGVGDETPKDRFRRVIRSMTGEKMTVHLDLRMDAGLGDLDIAQIIGELESELRVNLGCDTIEQLHSVTDIYRLVRRMHSKPRNRLDSKRYI